MRVAQIMLSNEFGGAERSFVDISQSLAELGHSVLAIGSKRSKSLDKLESFGIQSERVTCLGSWDVFAIGSIQKKLSEFKPDLVQCHLARASHLGGAAGRKLRIPVVAKTHNLVNPKYYKNVDKIVVTTEAQRSHLLAYGVETDRIRKIPNFSAIKSKSLKKRTASRSGAVQIVSLGRFVKKKGFDTLLRAFSLMKKNEEFNVKMKIGGDGPEKGFLMQLVTDLNISKRVEFSGWVEDVADFLAHADLFVLPSRDEPFGIVVLEAMATGIPILTTKTQGPLEILDQNMASFTMADNPVQMAHDMEALLHSEERFKLAQASKVRFDALYTSEKVCGQYCDLFRELIGE